MIDAINARIQSQGRFGGFTCSIPVILDTNRTTSGYLIDTIATDTELLQHMVTK